MDNAIIFKLISKENASMSVARTTINLSIWSTFFLASIAFIAVINGLMDLRYFKQPRLVPFDQFDAFWDNDWKMQQTNIYPLYTHLCINAPMKLEKLQQRARFHSYN